MALESYEICNSYPPLAEDIGAETENPGLAVRSSHTGTTRSRDEMSDEGDGSYASPEQITMRLTRSHTRRH